MRFNPVLLRNNIYKEMKLSECKRKNFSLFMYYIATVLKITKYNNI